MSELSVIDELFIRDIIGDETIIEHNFTIGYKLRRRRIIRDFAKSQSAPQTRRPLRLRYLLIAIISAVIVLLSAFGIYKFIEGFRVTEYDIYSMLYVTDIPENAPKTIEKKFYIDADLSGYKATVINDDEIIYWVEYTSENGYFEVVQSIYTPSLGSIGTGNALTEPTQTEISGHKAVYWQSVHGAHHYCILYEDYTIQANSTLDKNTLEKMLNSLNFK